jgi:hypothetical protein
MSSNTPGGIAFIAPPLQAGIGEMINVFDQAMGINSQITAIETKLGIVETAAHQRLKIS